MLAFILDINECLTLNGGCGSKRVCQNKAGSFECLPGIIYIVINFSQFLLDYF